VRPKQSPVTRWPPGLTHNLYSFAASPPPKENTSGRSEARTVTPWSTSASVDNKASLNQYARQLNKYKAGQSPATVYPERARSPQPGLSWLGDDEFESTGLAFRLASLERVDVRKPTGHSNPRRDTNRHGNPGSGTRENDKTPRTRVKASNNGDKKASRPRKDRPQESQSKQAVLEPSPTPRQPTHIDIESTDFTSLFGASPSLSTTHSSTSTKPTPTDDASRRVQLALEYHGGDYSRFISSSLVTSQGSPLAYAESAMARRRGVGSNRRNDALAIVQGMIAKSPGSQPTA